MATKRKRSATPESSDNGASTIFRSEEIVDRQSTFIGLYSPTVAPQELQKLAEIASAGHKILGWRRESNQQSLAAAKKYVSGHDDDGEKYGGKKAEQCLVNANVTGACVVARWYGGVMLGPVRFTHMESCALGAIQAWRDTVAAEVAKKRKLDEDAREKGRLIQILAARDQSIIVLRSLVTQKENKVKNAEAQDEILMINTTPTKAVTPDYNSMTVDRLQALDKARDATLGFLLKRIDKAEAELKSRKTDEIAGD